MMKCFQKFFMFFTLLSLNVINAQTSTLVYLGDNGRLVYTADSLGNVVPDFSAVGYMNSEESIPDVPVVKTVTAVEGDNLANVQNAINEIAAMPLDANGFRGAILFKAGTYNISDRIVINASGIVLRGEGSSESGTHFIATKKEQHSLIYFSAASGRSAIESSAKKITDTYVPIGTKQVSVEENHNFSIGEWVLLRRVPKNSWITLLDMAKYGWTASGYVVNYERHITKIEGNVIFLDAPVMDVIDTTYADGYLVKYNSSRTEKCGIENMRLSSTYTSLTDEQHGWDAVEFNNTINGWARNLDVYYFGYSAVNMKDAARNITVDNCKMIDPISETTGGRKYSFNIDGQRCLVQNCYTRGGRHDYVNGSQTAGPNVFYNSQATQQHADIGPHHRWSTGILFDNIVGNGAMNVQNRTSSGSGHGWAGSQIMFWNCTGNKFIVQNPPGDHINWSIGCVGNVTNVGDWVTEPIGYVEQKGTKVLPSSLFLAQLNDRLVPTSIPEIPENLSASSLSSTKIILSWEDKSDNEKLFRIERSTDSGLSWAELVTVSKNVMSYVDTGLTSGSTYYYRVRAENDLGNSEYSNIANATVPQSLPIAAPSNLLASAKSVSQIDLQWKDNSNNEDRFVVERSLDGESGWVVVINTNINDTSYSDIGLNDATQYFYRIKAENTQGNSEYSDIVSATTFQYELGDNLALNRPITASSEQLEDGNGYNPAVNAVDGDTSTRWTSGRDQLWPQWIEVDLGSIKRFNKTEVVCFNDRAYQFTIDVRNDTSDTTFTRIVDRTANTTPGTIALPITNVFNHVDARYVRLTVTGAHNYAGPWSGIVEFRIFNSTDVVGVENIAGAIPHDYKLYQNYPNPFNPTTKIVYNVPYSSKVKLDIFDILGRHVATLVDQEQNAGKYEVSFDASKLSSGIYVYRLATPNKIFYNKMLLMK